MNRWPRRGEEKTAALLETAGAVVLQRCPVTGGNEKPAELRIVDLCSAQKREVVMAQNRFEGVCDSCGQQRRQLQKQYEDNVCPSCMVIRIACKNRPEMVAEQLRKLTPAGLLHTAAPPAAAEGSLLAKLREILQAGDGDIVQAAERLMTVIKTRDVTLAERDRQCERLEDERDDLVEMARDLRERLQLAEVKAPFPQVSEEMVGSCPGGRDGVLLDLLLSALGDQIISLNAGHFRYLREATL